MKNIVYRFNQPLARSQSSKRNGQLETGLVLG
ncbi:uncharacterized protein METZ01_LOCUS434212, partial [marine metagenome]